MKKHTSEEAHYERMRDLAQVNKTSIKESQNRTLGTLIDTERAANGVAYGIVKEQHHYYIKKGGLNENLTVADFAYIGGVQNITEFQYDKLSVAEKQRNMLLKTINEGFSTKVSKTGSKKKMLTEDKAAQEIEMAASKVGELDAATAAEVPAQPAMAMPTVKPEGGAEMDAGLNAISGDAPVDAPVDDAPVDDAPVDDAPVDDGGGLPAGDDMPVDADTEVAGGEEEVAVEDPQSEATREIEKALGKLTNTLRKTELTEPQVKSYVNSFLSAFKDDFPEIDIEDRKEMADKITKVVPPEDIEDLGQNVEATDGEEPELAEEQCVECGGFAQYAESRGYNADSIRECGEEEMTNLVSGYANAHSEGQNDGDFKVIALFITPEILEKLKSDYGHDDFAGQVEPFSTEMNENSTEDRDAQINELFGTPVPTNENDGGIPVDSVQVQPMMEETAIEEDVDIKVSEKEGKKLSPDNVPEVEMKEAEEKEGDVLDNLDVSAEESPEGTPAEDIPTPEEKPAFSAGFEPMGGAVVKPEGAEITTVEVTKDSVNIAMNENDSKPSAGLSKKKKGEIVKKAKKGEDIGKKGKGFEKVKKAAEKSGAEDPEAVAAAAMWKNVPRESVEGDNVINESEAKLRKYIRNRLEEHAGIRKPSLNESKKSEKLQKLDRVIDKQFKLHETEVKTKIKK